MTNMLSVSVKNLIELLMVIKNGQILCRQGLCRYVISTNVLILVLSTSVGVLGKALSHLLCSLKKAWIRAVPPVDTYWTKLN